jgi:hypothetical protein
MKYQMQIKIVDPTTREAHWVIIKGSHLKEPYEYDTRAEAESMLRMCYGGALCSDEMRILEVK